MTQMTVIKLGNKKKSYKSIKEAAKAAGLSYITMYMRLRAGMTVSQAMKQPVRKYVKREQQIAA